MPLIEAGVKHHPFGTCSNPLLDGAWLMPHTLLSFSFRAMKLRTHTTWSWKDLREVWLLLRMPMLPLKPWSQTDILELRNTWEKMKRLTTDLTASISPQVWGRNINIINFSKCAVPENIDTSPHRRDRNFLGVWGVLWGKKIQRNVWS